LPSSLCTKVLPNAFLCTFSNMIDNISHGTTSVNHEKDIVLPPVPVNNISELSITDKYGDIHECLILCDLIILDLSQPSVLVHFFCCFKYSIRNFISNLCLIFR
jgi:hypothetical protein